MRRMKREVCSPMMFAVCAALFIAGCGDKRSGSAKSPSGKSGDAHVHAHKDDHDHAECEEGPHGGQLVELGDEYHAEVVADEKSHKVTVYLLDAKASNAVAIDMNQPEIFVNALVEGKSTSQSLTAARQQTDPEGQASRFELTNPPLFEAIFEKEDAKGRLRVTIAGKQFVGDIKHCEHGEHEHHDHKPK